MPQWEPWVVRHLYIVIEPDPRFAGCLGAMKDKLDRAQEAEWVSTVRDQPIRSKGDTPKPPVLTSSGHTTGPGEIGHSRGPALWSHAVQRRRDIRVTRGVDQFPTSRARRSTFLAM